MKNPNKLFPLFVSEDLEKTKKFYTEKAGFEIVFDMESYLHLRAGADESAPEISFMAPGSMPSGPNPGHFSGQGVIVSVPTPNADDKAEKMRRAGIEIVSEPADRPWGWRSFFVKDPNGVLLDFFHVLSEQPPTAGKP